MDKRTIIIRLVIAFLLIAALLTFVYFGVIGKQNFTSVSFNGILEPNFKGSDGDDDLHHDGKGAGRCVDAHDDRDSE